MGMACLPRLADASDRGVNMWEQFDQSEWDTLLKRRPDLKNVPGIDFRKKQMPQNAIPLIYDGHEDRRGRPPWEYPHITRHIKHWVLDGFLTPYQMDAWHWSYDREGSMLWWACGSGKTLEALLWLASGTGEGERQIVVTRAPTRRQWHREVSHYTNMHAKVLHGRAPSSLGDTKLVVLSWEIVQYWKDALIEWIQGHPSALVWDELHKGKAWQRHEKYVDTQGRIRYRWKDNRAAACAQLAQSVSRRLGLTATPIRDRRSDLWAQCDLIGPGCMGTNWKWVHRYCDAQPGSFGGINTKGISNCTELKLRLGTMTHVVPYAQMAQHLPPKRRQLVYLTKEDQSRPSAFAKDIKIAAKQGKQAMFEMRLLEAASRKRAWITETVLDAVEAGQKVVVFTGRRNDCEALAVAIRKAVSKLGARVWSGHGGDSMPHRDRMVREYAKYDEACAFIGTTDAFGEAIDGLQHTDLVVFGLLPWTPGQVTQAEGRFSRHGSTRCVLIMYTVAEGTVDEHVADFLLEKLEAVEKTLDDEEAGGVAKTLAGDEDEESIIQSILAIAGEME
jgi:hypothetical protein